MLQRALDQDVLLALNTSAGRIERELRRLERKAGIGAQVRRVQLQQTQAAMHREAATLWTRLGSTTNAAMHKAAAAGAETILRGSESVLRGVITPADRDLLVQSARASAVRALETAQERISGSSYVRLADSVYDNQVLYSGKIDEIVNAALVRGASARELANDVRAYINPATPGGARYAAMRLGRTELNNAFHASQVRQARTTPWVTALKWHLSGSHPKPDECNQYAEHNGDGIWQPNQMPAKPHPNCLCYTTPVTVDEDEFVNQYLAGSYDEFLGDAGVSTANKAVQATAPAAAKKAVVAKPKPPVDPFKAVGFPRMEPQGYGKASQKLVNPGSGHHSGDFNTNCHYVVNTMELRARGYDVVAAPTTLNTGRFEHSIAKDWVDPATGVARDFDFVHQSGKLTKGTSSQAEVMANQLAKAPPGSRGYVAGSFPKKPDGSGGGGHVFNWYKDEAGQLQFVEGQRANINALKNINEMTNVRFLRVDDLEPVAERVAETSTPKLALAGSNAVKRQRLQILIKRFTEDIPTDSNQSQRAWMSKRLAEAKVALAKLSPTP